MTIRSILCPVDFSATSEEALRYAVSLAAQLDVREVHLVHVRPEPDGESKERAARKVEGMAKRYSAHGAEVLPHVIEGVPYEAILAAARSLGADLIVIGTHGRTGLRHALRGSVAERVMQESPIPVCAVRTAA